jgi:hypothetical protein
VGKDNSTITNVPNISRGKIKAGRPIKPNLNLGPRVLVADTVGRILDKCKV